VAFFVTIRASVYGKENTSQKETEMEKKDVFFGNGKQALRFVRQTANVDWRIYWDEGKCYVCVSKREIVRVFRNFSEKELSNGKWRVQIADFRGMVVGYVEAYGQDGSEEDKPI
jgi:arginine deiminase